MKSILKKLFLTIIAGAALQIGGSVCAASQLGGLYKSGTTIALENVAKACKNAGKAMQKAASMTKAKCSKRPMGTILLASLSGCLAAASIGYYCAYKRALNRADDKKRSDRERDRQREEDEIFAYGLCSMTFGLLAGAGIAGTAALVFGN
ncbi:MAG TPA: hypothetical protein VGT41_01810 [Candidatus Babeliales bacterium]|nr:hypothetical protein [Candidatus Babeliales bacterium]